MDLITDVLIQKAKSAWAGLQSKLVTLGWRDKSTKIALFEAYVRSMLLFGSAIRGVKKLDMRGYIGEDATGEFGTFYGSCLYSILGVSHTTRNSILYILAGKPGKHSCGRI